MEDVTPKPSYQSRPLHEGRDAAPAPSFAAPRRPSPRRPLPSGLVGKEGPAEGAVAYAEGDRVSHRKFGRGIVRQVEPSGGDQLLTIDFDKAGTKLLMALYTGAMMKKEE